MNYREAPGGTLMIRRWRLELSKRCASLGRFIRILSRDNLPGDLRLMRSEVTAVAHGCSFGRCLKEDLGEKRRATRSAAPVRWEMAARCAWRLWARGSRMTWIVWSRKRAHPPSLRTCTQ